MCLTYNSTSPHIIYQIGEMSSNKWDIVKNNILSCANSRTFVKTMGELSDYVDETSKFYILNFIYGELWTLPLR